MDQKLTISKVAYQSGLSVPSIRFYEAQGIIPAPQRTDVGYRLYAPNDARRLQRARLLGLSLPEVKDHRLLPSSSNGRRHMPAGARGESGIDQATISARQGDQQGLRERLVARSEAKERQ